MHKPSNHLLANWSAPQNVVAFTTQQYKNIPKDPVYGNNNLALHVGDEEKCVLQNRQALKNNYCLPSEPAWLEQTHSTHCVVVEDDANRNADAAITRHKNQVLAIMTGDCLPIALCNTNGTEVAVIHAGWRGLANGIIEETLSKMHNMPKDLMAWVGPAICNKCYSIGDDVYNIFTQKHPDSSIAFIAQNNKIYADLPQIAELILQKNGVKHITQSHTCTFENHNTYYSARQSTPTGRIATLIWMQ
jgi:polyphenol oxidase